MRNTLLRKMALVSGLVILLLAAGSPLTQAIGTAGQASSSALVSTAASPARTSTPSPSPAPTPASKSKHKNKTVTNPGPLPPGAARPGVKPSTGASRLQRSLVASGTAVPASSLTAGPCTLVGAIRTCELWATTGTMNFPGTAPLVLPVWGFATSAGAAGQVPAPTLVAMAGETIQIIVHNALPVPTPGASNDLSIEMPAAGTKPDIRGAHVGAQKTYTFSGLAPGTYLYEAGPTPFGARQVRMGLAGIMVVRPTNFAACGCAYGSAAGDGFVDEATLLLNEFDPAFNADPFGFDPVDFTPTEFAINGLAYDPKHPTASKISVAAGNILLLRYANLTDHERGITIANERQVIRADDSYVLTNPGNVATKWLNPGQVSDSFVTIDPSFPLNTHIPVYDAGFHFNNGGDLGLGGMFTYLDVVQGLAGNPSGPVTTVNATPTTNTGTQDMTVTGTINGSSALHDAEWFLDDPGVPGTAPAAQHFAVSGTSASFTFTIPAATLHTMLMSSVQRDGDHIVWVHGKDSSATGPWGVVSGDVFTFNETGPVIGALSTHVSPTNGTRPTDVANGGGTVVNGVAQNAASNDVVVLGMAASSLSNFIVTGAEYCIDVTPCTPTPIVLTPSGSNGTQAIDAYGAALTTPAACMPVPSPPGINPPGLPAAPGGGSVVSFCGIVPASALSKTGLAEGLHTLYIRACEQVQASTTACNAQKPPRWSAFADASITFVVDHTPPAASGIALDPDPNNGHLSSAGNLNFLSSLQLSATLTDPVTAGVNSNIAYGEVMVTCSPLTQASCKSTTGPIDPATNAAPPDGTGAEMIPSGAAWDSPTKLAFAYIPLAELTAYPEGWVRFWVHAQDQAGNFGPWSSTDMKYDKTPPVFDTPALPVPPAPPTGIACTAGCTISFTAHDPISGGVNSNIVQAEWFVDNGATLICESNFTGCTPEVAAQSDPGYGNGNAVSIPTPLTPSVTASITLGPQAVGTHIVFRVRDAAGNWSLDNLVVTQ